MLHHSIFLFFLFLLYANFNKSTLGLDFLLILYMLAKFQDNLRLITMSWIKCLNFKFWCLKLCIKDGFLDWIVNCIWLAHNLVCMLKTYLTCSSIVRFLKYQSNKKNIKWSVI